MITRIALIHPEIAIKLISSGKTIIQTTGNGNMQSVVYGIYGKEIAENILDVAYEYEDIRITGVIGKPVISRSNRANQLFFVNQRYIKDKTLSSSAEQAFKGMITIGKFGFLILNIELNPQKVDVNVHPAKLEVRFEEEQKVFKAVYHAIKDTLLKNDLVSNPENAYFSPEHKIEEKIEEKVENKIESRGLFQKILARKEPVAKPTIIEELYETRKQETPTKEANFMNNKIDTIIESERPQKEQEEKIEEIKKEKDITEHTQVIDLVQMPKEENQETMVITEEMKQKLAQTIEEKETEEIQQDKENLEENPQKPFEQMYTSIFGKAPVVEAKGQVEEEPEEYKLPEPQIITGENISVFEKEERGIPQYKFIGIAFSTYIIIELQKDLYMIDQHAAHERIMYEKIKENYLKEEGKDSQLMLLPDIITLTHKEMDIAKENMEMFEKAGFMLEEFGENTIKLTGVPDICLELDTKELFLETLDEINTVARTAKQEIEEKFIATIACKAAVKANMALSKEEVENLMEQLLKLPNPFTCPHGRPTAIKMTKTDIEKKFSRR